MAKRMIDTDLWNNEEIIENFTAEDKYFWLYLLTSPHNNICGVFKNSPTLMARDMGLHKDTIVNLLYRFENVHKLVYADKDTNEVLILNWYKFNWNKSPKLRILIDNEFAKITSETISILLAERIGKIFGQDTVSIPYPYPTISNPISNSISNSLSLSNSNNEEEKKKKSNKKKKPFVPPTFEEVQAYATEKGRLDLAQRFYDYYTATEWTKQTGKPVLDWKKTFNTWIVNNTVHTSFVEKSLTSGTTLYDDNWVQDDSGAWRPKK